MNGLMTVAGDQMAVMKLAPVQSVIKEAAANVYAASEAKDEPKAEPAQPGTEMFAEVERLLTTEHVAQVGAVSEL